VEIPGRSKSYWLHKPTRGKLMTIYNVPNKHHKDKHVDFVDWVEDRKVVFNHGITFAGKSKSKLILCMNDSQVIRKSIQVNTELQKKASANPPRVLVNAANPFAPSLNYSVPSLNSHSSQSSSSSQSSDRDD
jgi:hypothetical protein